jgi:1,4-alpha-glucan branching enzyme
VQYQPPDKSFFYQAYYRVDEEAERLKAKAETTSSRKTSPEIIDIDATPVKTSTATKEDKEAAFVGKKDDSSKKGWKFARQSSNKNTK